MKRFLLAAAAVAFTAAPAMAEIRWCPIDRAYYDTETGLIVDRPARSSYTPRRQQCVKIRTNYGWHYNCP